MLSRSKREAIVAAIQERGTRRLSEPPPLPGSVLEQQFLRPKRLTQRALARAMGVSAVAINHIVHGRNAITAEMAARLATATNTSPWYWLRLQAEYDLAKLENIESRS